MNSEYNPQNLENQVQQSWEDKHSFEVIEDIGKEKFYCLSMLPYPSGELHMGHLRNYTIGDVVSRYQRMLGKNVLQPMGWDGFGLPAENAALQHKTAPSKWTYDNIATMRELLKRMGLAIDWKREFTTCNPDFYRWEQWLFVRLYKKGLAYKKNAMVNWDPVDQTVLANEQVVNGHGWRSGAKVERREIPQWFLKITAYADELLDGLKDLHGWPDQVKTMQRNWIGRSEGLALDFQVADREDVISVYTTRADTLMGASYVAIAADHPLAHEAAKKNPAIASFIEICRNIKVAEAELATLEKQGVDSGYSVIHPLSGKKLPIWVANYIVMDYGTGAVMAVPAHDQRDFEFANTYKLPIKPVITPAEGPEWDFSQSAFTEPGVLVNSTDFDGLTSEQAIETISDTITQKNRGERQVHYRLRDWGVSRQRYWGTPIPIIYCDGCGTVPVPEKDLPVVLPEDVTLDKPGSPLKSMPSFYETDCPNCGNPARRETDTFDTFMESSWYYTRYACADQHDAMLDDRAKYWTPVDQYIGGIEHAVMHLLYARFMHRLLRDEGLVNSNEPFTRLLTQGMVLKDGAKMSKSKGNTVSPQDMIDRYGADTARLFVIFASPPEQSLEWSDTGVDGAYRFLKRLWTFTAENQKLISKAQNAAKIDWTQAPDTLRNQRREVHEILRQATSDMQRLQFNTVVSAAMKLSNLAQKIATDTEAGAYLLYETISILLRILTPITPHITTRLWQDCDFIGNIIDANWPKVEQSALRAETIELIVQVNGKLRSKITVPSNAEQDTIQSIALADPKVVQHMEGKPHKKVIVVPKRLVNIVV